MLRTPAGLRSLIGFVVVLSAARAEAQDTWTTAPPPAQTAPAPAPAPAQPGEQPAPGTAPAAADPAQPGTPPPPPPPPSPPPPPPAQAPPGAYPYPPPYPPPVTEPPPPPAAPDPGDRTHDGFYLRMALGYGLLLGTLGFDDDLVDFESDVSGHGIATELALGGTIASGFVLGGGLYATDVGEVDLDASFGVSGGTGEVSETTVEMNSFGLLGLFGDWYFDPKGGLHAQAALGIGVASIEHPLTSDEIAMGGLGWMLGIGYEAFIADEWSLGGLARVVGGSLEGEDPDDSSEKWRATLWSPVVLFTATYH